MIKNTINFIILLCTAILITGCTNTQPKVSTTDKTELWAELETQANMSLVKPNFTGHWVLNAELSENPQKGLQKRMRQSKNAGDNKNMRSSGEHGGKGKGGKRGDSYSRNKNNSSRQTPLPQSLHALLIASKTLELKHEEPLLSIITQDGQQDVYTDFRSTSVSSNIDPSQKITIAGWEKNILVIENTINTGRFIQQFSLNSLTGQLLVNTLISNSSLPKPIQFNRVYDLVTTKVL